VISQLNSDFDHMFGLVNGFCDQKSEQSELNWPILVTRLIFCFDVNYLRYT
jgi:hypothetical protein